MRSLPPNVRPHVRGRATSLIDTLSGVRVRDIYDRVNELLDGFYDEPEEMEETPILTKLGVRLALPDNYKGQANLEVFEDWLSKLLDWFRNYRLNVNSNAQDTVRLNILGSNLSDVASSFFRDSRSHYRQLGEEFSFGFAVLLLRNRFLHRSTAMDAADQFESARQGTGDVQSFMDTLRRWAQRMAEYPSQYELRRRFTRALAKHLSAEVIRQGHSPERSQLEVLLNAALDYEQSLRYVRDFESHSKPNASTVVRRTTNSTRPAPRFPTRQRTPAAGPSVNKARAAPDRSRVTCFNCQEVGHYSSECEKPAVPKAFAARVNDDDEDDRLQEDDLESVPERTRIRP